MKNDQKNPGLNPYFSRLGTWAFSIGTSIGWGSFIVTCNTYLSQAGVAGTIFGILVGMAVILIINHNLCYMMVQSPDAGGLYTYCNKVRNSDTGFMVAWFLLLTYIAVLWANITSLPLFASRFIGAFFQVGFSYTVFGYKVYLGEALVSTAAIIVAGALCAHSRKIVHTLMIVMAVVFVAALAIVTVVPFVMNGSSISFEPAYIPNKSELGQIVRIAVISPWAFIGFENAAHFSEEFTYPVKKVRHVMLWSVLLTTAVYILMTLLSVSAFPPEYRNWLDYVRDMGNLNGIKAIPAFYAAEHYMGSAGVSLLLVALLAVILTSIIGNLTAISRLLYAFGRDHYWAAELGKLNEQGIPGKAIGVTVAVSCFIPFLGRTAIGWIVDVTTLGATIIYGFLSYAVMWDSKKKGDRTETVTGALGAALMAGFAVLLLAPKIIAYDAMAAESYLLFAAWSMLGLVVFRSAIHRDRENKYGHSIIVWVMLLLLMLLTTMMWTNRRTQLVMKEAVEGIQDYYSGYLNDDVPEEEADAFVTEQIIKIENADFAGTIATFALFIIAVVIMSNNYRIAYKRELEWEQKLGVANEIGLTDGLTGIKNKYAYSRLEEQIESEIESEDCEPFAIVVCDLNNLKLINDVQGHHAGDECIKEASRFICRTFSHSPVFRYGGDEFVVFLRGEDYENRIKLKAELDSRSEDPDAKALVIAAGMVEYNQDEHKTMLRVFEEADQKMYERKKLLKSKDKADQ